MLSPVRALELAATLICHGTACGHPLPHTRTTHTHTYIQNYTTSDFVLFVRLVRALLCCYVLCSNQSQNYVQVPVICTTNPIKCKCCRPSRSATLHQLAELSCVSYQHQTEANQTEAEQSGVWRGEAKAEVLKWPPVVAAPAVASHASI